MNQKRIRTSLLINPREKIIVCKIDLCHELLCNGDSRETDFKMMKLLLNDDEVKQYLKNMRKKYNFFKQQLEYEKCEGYCPECFNSACEVPNKSNEIGIES